MRNGLDRHNATCDQPVEALLLNPIDHGLLGWDELWGLPVLADDSVRVKSFRVKCARHTEEYQRDVPGPPV
jgi:hypothetical protein